MPTCGSLTISAPPLRLRLGATARLLLPERPSPPMISPSPARSVPPKLGTESRPFSTRRAQISGQSSRPRSLSTLAQTSQLTSAPARRPKVSTSATLQGSRSRPSTRNSCGSTAAFCW